MDRESTSKKELEESQEIRFDGKVAVVTGAGGGLGRVYALELAKRGAKLVVNDLGGARDGSGPGSQAPADKVVEEIRALGGEALASYDTVSTPQGGEAIVRKALGVFGRVDILINNAGILRDKTLVNMEPGGWSAVLEVHLNGAYNVTRPAFAQMREQGYGRIIMTTSSAGLYGNFGQANYAAAKMALVGFMNALKLEGAKYNVLVNAVAPMAATRLTQDVLPAELFQRLNPEFVAPLVVYLCSEKCKETGRIYNAGAGYFNRVALLTGEGMLLGEGLRPPSAEEVSQHWEAINAMEGAREFPNAASSMEPMIRALAKAQRGK